MRVRPSGEGLDPGWRLVVYSDNRLIPQLQLTVVNRLGHGPIDEISVMHAARGMADDPRGPLPSACHGDRAACQPSWFARHVGED
jgi:hypothetical protein